jgi:hypothetical protein
MSCSRACSRPCRFEDFEKLVLQTRRVSPAASHQSRSTAQRLMACLARLLFALFVTGGALPAGGPSAVHGFDGVEEDEKTTKGASDVRAGRHVKRSRTNGSHGLATLEVPSVLAPTRAAPQAPTWMRPRRTLPPDDDDIAA